MAMTRSFLMLTSFLALVAVLGFYIVISKTELTVPKMVKIFSKKEDICFHSMEMSPIPIPSPKLTNGELYRKQRADQIQTRTQLLFSGHTGQIRLLKEKAVWIEVSVQTLPCHTAHLNPL